ncbi:diguanylate cyclase (GGDEF) domain-containing protein [Kushneria avicenniae]|uniref:diguanylate cyclase n=1 Tax=Kushneria avicenniae TaxID=402385 RepID=A0A1I1KKI7_9GAMM|nr:sensor domain-containing diguanylate cyclase [Kushneria avicenniae]SFC61317.1 diguanylate cyclase (GGDEF) domain-containing protein [Kushneria avicenniae]
MRALFARHGDLLLTLLALPCVVAGWWLTRPQEHLLLAMTAMVVLPRLAMHVADKWHPHFLKPVAMAMATIALIPLLSLLGSFILPDTLVDYGQWSALFNHWLDRVPFYSLRPSILIILALLFLLLLSLLPSRSGGVAPIALAMAATLTVMHLIEQHWFRSLHEVSLSTPTILIIFLLLASEAIAQWPQRRMEAVGVALAASMTVMVVLLILWHYHNDQNIREVNKVARTRVDALSERLGQEINVSDQAMQRFALSWDSAGGLPSSRAWTHRARRLAEHFGYMETIAYIDRQGPRIRHAFPLQSNQPLLGHHVLSSEDDQALPGVLQGRASATGMVNLTNGGRGVIFYQPVRDLDSAAVRGAAAFVIDPARLFATLDNTRDGGNFRVRVMQDGDTIYSSKTPKNLSMLEHCNILQLGQSNFTLCAEASYARLFDDRSKLPAIVLLTGLIFTWMLYLLMYFHHRLRRRHNGIKDANYRLRGEVEKRIALQQEVEWLAQHDELTGLPNRRYFSQWFGRLDASGFRTVILLDIDHFKQINDRMGHPTGDEYLQRVAHRLQEIVTAGGGLLARFGGEEFIACLPEMPPERAADIGEQLRRGIEGLALPRHDSNTTVTISAGLISTRRASDTLMALIEIADQALYRAKLAGRNRVEVAGAMDTGTSGRQDD